MGILVRRGRVLRVLALRAKPSTRPLKGCRRSLFARRRRTQPEDSTPDPRAKSALTAHKSLVRTALLIREFETRLLDLYQDGKLFGTVHTCVGQEWVGVAAAHAARSTDTFFSNHRGHGHFLAHVGDTRGLMAEVMGKATGVCAGIGGSQHLYAENFLSNGIQGGMVPVAAGRALGGKLLDSDDIALVFVGDGTFGEGTLYEGLNLASIWRAPLLVVAENNHIAQTTPTETTIGGSISARAESFGMRYWSGDTRQWIDLLLTFEEAVNTVREDGVPGLIEVNTFRLNAHSKGDDTREPAEIERARGLDPLVHLDRSFPVKIAALKASVVREVDEAVVAGEAAALASPERADGAHVHVDTAVSWNPPPERTSGRYVDLLNETLKREFTRNERLMLIGEDLHSPYGGAFKVTRDMSDLFGDRVRNSPISEAGIIGMGSGLALAGWVPLVEIMFGDFLGLGFDQILNHACKFRYMSFGKVRVPLVIRTPMGGYRGYGPTHSQSIEKHFLGIPDLEVLALNIRVAPQDVYTPLFESIETPTLVVENKVLYTRFLRSEKIPGFEIEFSDERFSTVRIRPAGKRPDVTLFCYGGMLELAEDAIQRAFDEEDIICEIICPTRISPLNIQPVLDSVAESGRLLTVEEGNSFAALGAEVVAQTAERLGVNGLRAARRGGYNTFLPTSGALEQQALPSIESVFLRIVETFHAG